MVERGIREPAVVKAFSKCGRYSPRVELRIRFDYDIPYYYILQFRYMGIVTVPSLVPELIVRFTYKIHIQDDTKNG